MQATSFEDLRAAGLDEESAKKLFTFQIVSQARFYNKIVEKCFGDCVSSFRSNDLYDHEAECVDHCSDKYLAICSVMDTVYWKQVAEQQQEMLNAQKQ